MKSIKFRDKNKLVWTLFENTEYDISKGKYYLLSSHMVPLTDCWSNSIEETKGLAISEGMEQILYYD